MPATNPVVFTAIAIVAVLAMLPTPGDIVSHAALSVAVQLLWRRLDLDRVTLWLGGFVTP